MSPLGFACHRLHTSPVLLAIFTRTNPEEAERAFRGEAQIPGPILAFLRKRGEDSARLSAAQHRFIEFRAGRLAPPT
ncbi:MAG: hypothetical protein KY468_09250 [Armatimonadetes bacterium]|nr:hypothetical protein [Armatimonadota bacterium]